MSCALRVILLSFSTAGIGTPESDLSQETKTPQLIGTKVFRLHV